MVLQMRGTILLGHKWDMMVDLFFYREPEETKDQEVDEGAGPVPDFGVTEYGDSMLANDQWGGDVQQGGDAVAAPSLAAGGDWTDIGWIYLQSFVHNHHSHSWFQVFTGISIAVITLGSYFCLLFIHAVPARVNVSGSRRRIVDAAVIPPAASWE
ncbi:hypothetical protein MKW92_009876 [Papaver armeniacum]|nr:hypothetical protein MKW92_009876 [Papaver armeniacum]